MGTPITSCCQPSDWVEKALLKAAQFDEDFYGADDTESEDEPHAPMPQSVVDELNKIHEDMNSQFVNPAKKQRQIGVNHSAKAKAQKKIYEVTKGYHKKIPLAEIFAALDESGLVPVQEDGYRWNGVLVGAAECGTPEARNQMATIDIATKDASGKWGMANVALQISWCRMNSGSYEVVCYLG